MMDGNIRIGILSAIAEKQPNIGKTSIMKYMFFLQYCYGIPLGYDFSIYTYGPYAQDVMSDLDLAVYYNAIERNYIEYPNGYGGYEFSRGKNWEPFAEKYQEYSDQIDPLIARLVTLFCAHSARDMELSATIAYVHIALIQQGQDLTQLPSIVKALKPHFDLHIDIEPQYEWLKQQSVLN